MNKKIKLLAASAVALLSLTSCGFGNHQAMLGQMTFNYVYVKSTSTEPAYYHIKTWKEYAPEGRYMGIEFNTVSDNYYYFYEFELSYVLTKNRVSTFGTPID